MSSEARDNRQRLIEFRVLGSLEAVDDGRRLPLGGRQQRAVLATLLLRANELVPSDRLIEAIWGERSPPPTAATTVQVYISRLRKLLGRELLLTRAPGYLLHVEPEQIDVGRAERLIAAGHETREPVRRAALFRDALALWRGPALADFVYMELARTEAERLEELRLATLESAVGAEIELGRHSELVAELEAMVDEHPLRESLRKHLMLSLYRAGRQADALAVYRDGRRKLVEALGLEPGPSLRQLEQQILAHDPALGPASVPKRDPQRGERKVLSALFAELVGIDDQSPPLDPEEVRSLLEPQFARIRTELERFGASVATPVGDSVLAVFGAPVAHEDHAERAVRAALSVRDLIAEAGGGPPGPRLGLRAGVSTGEALVPAGEAAEWSGSAFGAVFGTADRIRSTAPPNTVVVTEPTYLATREVISYRPLPGGSSWKAVAPTGPIRNAGPRAGEAALVGRADELHQVLRRLLSSAEANVPELLTIVGTPGIGKTRLVREMAASGTPPDALWLQGRSIPYGDGVAYWAFAEAVKGLAGILDTDEPGAVGAKLHRTIADFVPDAPEAIENSLRVLLGLEAADAAAERAGAFLAWRRFLEAIATLRPVVLALEDVHWADDGLLDFVEYVARSSRGMPLVLLCTARPELRERRETWAVDAPHATTVDLAPLSDGETRTLVGALLGGGSVGSDLQDQIVSRVGGNPLFTEEYLRTLVDRGSLRRTDAGWQLEPTEELLPRTVQNVIAARLDVLPVDAKLLLQDASVVGKVFWSGSVAAIGGRSRLGCEAQLEDLVQRDFLLLDEPSAMHDEAQYAFRHVLIRDVAYSQIPRAERSVKHRSVAEWIESHARSDDVAEFMAHHYGIALELGRAGGVGVEDLLQRTIAALWRAGERARHLYANDDAAAYFSRALALLEEPSAASASWHAERYVSVQESLGDVLELMGSHVTGEGAFAAALSVVPHEERLRRGRLLRKQALSRQLQRRIEEARETFAAADDALGETPLGAAWWHERCEIAVQRLQLLYFGRPLDEFTPEVHRVKPLIEARGTPAQRSFFFHWLAMALMRRDRFVTSDEVLAYEEMGLAASFESESLSERAFAHFAHGFCLLWARRLEEAEAQLRASLALSERIGEATTGVRCLNYLAVRARWRGDVESARDLATRTLDEARRTEMVEYVFQSRATLAWVAWREGNSQRVVELGRSVWPGWDDVLIMRVFAWMPLWPLLGVALAGADEAGAFGYAATILDPTRQPMPADLESLLTDAVAAQGRGEAPGALAATLELATDYGYL